MSNKIEISQRIEDAMALYFDGKLDRAIQLLGNTEAEDETDQARILAAQGKLLSHKAFLMSSSCEEAINMLSRAAELAENLGEEMILGSALSYRGFAIYTNTFHNNIGRYEDAVPDVDRALEIRERIGDLRGVAESLIYRGILHERLEENELGKAAYERSAQISDEHGYELEASYAYRHLAYVRQREGNLEGAVEYFEKSLAQRLNVGFRIGTALAHFALGYALMASERYEDALIQNKSALGLSEEFGLTRVATLCYYIYGEIYAAQENPFAAIKNLERSRDLSNKIGYEVGIERAEKRLAELSKL